MHNQGMEDLRFGFAGLHPRFCRSSGPVDFIEWRPLSATEDGKRISTSNSEAMVLSWKNDFHLHVENELPP